MALSVSCNFVFLYVFFEALLDQADIGRFFMRLSFGRPYRSSTSTGRYYAH
ncbi:TRAP transporter, 4TM/12TM fusion domain protein [Anaplasma phagocytophilum str. CRT53-1]|uniref:TRAP transporter, 4TM/12TM fusion domain protein n=1 Tax=Anaplasma phagocytophilum str. CRT53-1 TaxID=1359157 RepID=A0A0F3Q5H9_ANAPH|nr:TRAP transporter, 4TM/12TM fusion domain protein [Anaplasma phagocytophilum str. CRT53-1]